MILVSCGICSELRITVGFTCYGTRLGSRVENQCILLFFDKDVNEGQTQS